MAKKKGICRNEECEMCDPSIIQEADEFNFVCEKCGQELFPVGNTTGGDGGGWKKWAIIGAAVVVLGGGGAVIAFSGGEDAPEKEVKSDTIQTPVAKTDSAAKEKQEAPVEETLPEEKSEETQPGTTEPVKVNPGSGTVNLGYGKYEGDLKNGKPHGHGTITYTRSHQIVSSKDFVANPGDKFEGEFRHGRISGSIGYWYHDGDITAIQP